MKADSHASGPQPAGQTAVTASIDDLVQGDVLEIGTAPILKTLRTPLARFLGPASKYHHHKTEYGVVVLSQTCDIVRDSTSTVVVAPVTRLTPPTDQEARQAKRPRYVAVPGAGSDAFADLDTIFTVDKTFAFSLAKARGLVTDDDIRKFGWAVGRRFSRFAFPDAVVWWLQPLQRIAATKHSKNSAEGDAFRSVLELRVESHNGWSSPPYELTMAVIVERGVLPPLGPGDDWDMRSGSSKEIHEWLRHNGALRASSEIAQRLSKTEAPLERQALWQGLGESWAALCKPDEKELTTLPPNEQSEIRSALLGGEVSVEVLGEDEYTLFRYRRSEQLDLDYLSPLKPV